MEVDFYTFEEWRMEYFTAGEIAQEGVGGPFADPDADGMVNLLEFGFASNPNEGDGQDAIQLDVELLEVDGQLGRYATMTFTRPLRSELQYVMEQSSDLFDWKANPLILVGANIDPVNQTETVTVRAREEIGSQGRQLMRIHLRK